MLFLPFLVLYYIALVKHELSQKYTRKSFHAAAGGIPPRHGLPPKQKILDETLTSLSLHIFVFLATLLSL